MYRPKVYRGWLVVTGCTLTVFGVFGSQFSFGVFLKPMTEEFGWSRTTLSLAFGITFMLAGLLRPVAGYLVDRYSPRIVVSVGVAIVGCVLLLIPLINSKFSLFLLFGVLSIGITLGSGPTLTKVISGWFYEKRGLTLNIVNGGGSVGAMVLVPATAVFLLLFDWRQAYVFLGIVILCFVLPVGFFMIRNRPQDVGVEPLGATSGPRSPERTGLDSTFKEVLRLPIFWRLTFGYFV